MDEVGNAFQVNYLKAFLEGVWRLERALDDRRVGQLEPLWNEWGQVRPVLLMDRHALGSVPG